MSDLTGHKLGGNEMPNEDVRQDRDESLMDARVASDGSEDGEVQDDIPVGTKRNRSPSSEAHPLPKRTKPATELGIGLFTKMRNPRGRMPCVISVDNGEPIGSLYAADDGFAIMLFLDAGRFGPPTISLGFGDSGTKPCKDLAHSRWDTGTLIRGNWAIDRLGHGYATPDATDPRMSNPAVLARCGPRDMGELLYVKFDSHPDTMGYFRKGSFKDQNRGIQRSLKTIFQPQKSYSLELWFIPSFKATDFRKNCLRFFSDSMEQRVQTLDLWRDSNGYYFKDELKGKAPKVLALEAYGKSMLRGHKRPPGMKVPEGQQAGEIEYGVAVDDAGHRAEQSDAGPSLGTQHLEYATPIVAQDTKMSDHSTASSIEVPPKIETQAMLTVEAGPVSPPVGEQKTSASGSFIAQSSLIHSPEGYVPSFMFADSDGSDIDLGLDSVDDVDG